MIDCRGGRILVILVILMLCATSSQRVLGQRSAPLNGAQKVIFDTDIGDDIDDASALALALSTPKLQVVGVTTAWGDTHLSTRLAARLTTQCGHSDIPVAAGPKTASKTTFSQA